MVPEITVSGFVPLILLISGHWVLFLITCPLAGYLFYRYRICCFILLFYLSIICILLFIYLSIQMWSSIHSSIHPFILLSSIYQSIHISIYSTIYPSMHSSINPFRHRSIRPLIFPLIKTFVFYPFRYFTLPKSMIGIYDPAIIRNGNQLVDFQKEAFIKIGCHLIIFFICLYL